MKIQILTQRIINKEVMNHGLAIAKSWMSTIGINLEYSFRETTKQFTTQSYSNPNTYTYVNPQEILDEADISNKIVCLLHDIDGVTNPFQHPILKNGCNPIQIPEDWWVTYPEVLAQYLLHEICHSGYFFANNVQGDRTHNMYESEYSQKQPQEYYLHLLAQLKPFLETTVTSYPTLRIRSNDKVAVKELQTLLNYWGFNLLVDGSFGNNTLKAVILFQKSKGLVADGIVGNKTWIALKKKV